MNANQLVDHAIAHHNLDAAGSELFERGYPQTITSTPVSAASRIDATDAEKWVEHVGGLQAATAALDLGWMRAQRAWVASA